MVLTGVCADTRLVCAEQPGRCAGALVHVDERDHLLRWRVELRPEEVSGAGQDPFARRTSRFSCWTPGDSIGYPTICWDEWHLVVVVSVT